RLGESLVALVVVKGALYEADSLCEPIPDLLAEWRTRMVLDRVEDQFHEVLVRPVPPGEPHQREVGRQQPAVGEVVDRRHHLLTCEVAGYAEDDHGTRTRDMRHPLIALVAQWITPCRHFLA